MTDLRGITKSVLAVAVLSAILNPVMVQATTVKELQQQQAQKQAELDQANAAAANAKKQAQAYQSQISSLSGQITDTQKKIDETSNQITSVQSQIDSLSTTIDEKNKQLALLKQKLNNAIVEVYRFSSRSDLEVLFGGSTLSNSSNQTNYIQAVEIQVKSIFSQVQSIKDDLTKQKSNQEAQRAQLDQLKGQQTSYSSSMQSQKSKKDKLLGMTIQQQQAYEENAQNAMEQIATISAEIRRKLQASSGSNTRQGGTGGYPYPNDPASFSPYSCSPNYDTSFCKRNCTDYAAWKWSAMGYPSDKLYGAHNANNWDDHARANGLRTGSTPQAGALIVWNLGTYGHVAYVEEVYKDSTFKVSEYNFSPAFEGKFSTDIISVNSRSSMGTPVFIYP